MLLFLFSWLILVLAPGALEKRSGRLLTRKNKKARPSKKAGRKIDFLRMLAKGHQGAFIIICLLAHEKG